MKYQQAGKQIELVDQHAPLLPFGKQFGDAVHPDGITYRAMALTWLPKVLAAIYRKTVVEQKPAE